VTRDQATNQVVESRLLFPARATFASTTPLGTPLVVASTTVPTTTPVANGTLFYHQDGLGSVTELTTNTGSVAKAYAYDAYGNILESPGTVNQPYTYTGRELDSETGLYYYRARYYDAETGRFLQKDPIGLRGGINIYRYASNNPTLWRDPVGLYDFGNTFDAISNVFSVAGDGEYYGAAIGGGIGAVAGAPAGPPGVIGGAVLGSVVGGLIGFGFDERCAGILNCNEVIPLAGDYSKYGSCSLKDIQNGTDQPPYTLSDTDYRNGPLFPWLK